MKNLFLLLVAVFACAGGSAQTSPGHAPFPQEKINSAALQNKPKHPAAVAKTTTPASAKSIWSAVKKMEELKTIQPPSHASWVQSNDTIFVGVVPHDTMVITGYWTHSGPILVFNDGVLIFKNATVIDSGDVYVFQQGQLIADSSSLTFPQQYFYQRSLIATQNATMNIQHSSFNYSGLSHNLVISGNATVLMNEVHQNDWTTCGLFGKPTLAMNRVNLAGEYILSDSSTAFFTNTDTILLWHQFPDTAVVNFTFPNGDTVYNYNFNNSVAGVNGVEYAVSADSCHDVMWAMMPVNGSDVKISNSEIRAIGNWFQHNDTATVSGLYDNSAYINFTAPLSDRNLQLVNCTVQTWSLYVFDDSHIDLDSCQVGEVGTQQRATVMQSVPFLLDGSGGYYWATDTSAIFSFGATIYSYARSEKNGIFVLAYGWLPFSAPQAIGSSVMISVQSTTAADPVAYEAATTWLAKIDGPDTSYTNMQVPVSGSAWIDWGPAGSGWMDFASYSMYYQLQGNTAWTRILADSLQEIRHSTLKNWNTQGLAAGNYNIKLTVKNNLGDSVEAIRPITLLPGLTGINAINNAAHALLYPNPGDGIFFLQLDRIINASIEIYDITGRKILTQPVSGSSAQLDLSSFSSGIYELRVINNNKLLFDSRIIRP